MREFRLPPRCMRFSLFWDVTQLWLFIYWRFGTTYRSPLQGISLWKNDPIVQTQITLQYFKTLHLLYHFNFRVWGCNTDLLFFLKNIVCHSPPRMWAFWWVNNNNNYLLFSRLLSHAHSWQLVTGQLAALVFYRSWCARQGHLAGSQETWMRNGGNLAYATFLFMPVRFFYMP
jgi:hypothetical protein